MQEHICGGDESLGVTTHRIFLEGVEYSIDECRLAFRGVRTFLLFGRKKMLVWVRKGEFVNFVPRIVLEDGPWESGDELEEITCVHLEYEDGRQLSRWYTKALSVREADRVGGIRNLPRA